MPRIERYTRGIVRQRSTAQLVNSRAISDAVMPYQGAAGISGAAADITDKFVQAKETTAVNEAIIKNKKRKMEYLDQARQENMANPEDFAKRIEPELKKIDDEFAQSLPTGRAKGVFQERMMQVNMQAYEQNYKWEKTRQVDMFAESVESSALELGNMAYMRGQQGASLDDLIKDAEATVIAGSTFVEPEKIAELSRGTMKTIERNYAMGLMESNPQAAIDYLNDLDRSGSITAGDRVNLVKTAGNIKQANQRRAERDKVKGNAIDAIENSDIKSRILDGVEPPEKLIADIRTMELEGKIKESQADDLVKVVNARGKVSSGGGKPSFAEQDRAFNEMSIRMGDLVNDDFTLTNDTIKSFTALENDLIEGITSGALPKTSSKKMLKELRQAMSTAIENDNVERDTWSDYFSGGIEKPIAKGLSILKDEGGSITKQRMIFSKYTDLLADYKSTGINAKDEKVIRDKLEEAKKLYNEEINRSAVDAGANAVVAPVPKAGDIVDGFRFNGGDPADPKNWEEVK